MKKFLLLAVALCLSFYASADLLLTEDFDYPFGDDLLQHSWVTSYGTASTCGITISNGLEFPNYAGCGIGYGALINCISRNEQAHLRFEEVTEGNVYVAFMFEPTLNYGNGYFFALRDNFQTGGSSFNMVGRIFLDEDNQVGLAFADNQKRVWSGVYLEQNEVYLFVLKYSIIEGKNNDKVSLYILTSVVSDEPEEPLLLVSDAAKTDINPACVMLRGYNSDYFLYVDGIRVATTWQEAVAEGVCPMEMTGVENVIESDERIEVFNALGTKLGDYAVMPDLPQGIYFVRQGKETRKVLR